MRVGRFCFLGLFTLWGMQSITSCKKDNSTQPLSAAELLTGTKWQLRALYITDSPYVDRTDFTSQYYSPCELNDIYEFKKASTLSRTRTDTSCSSRTLRLPDDGASWQLEFGGTALLITKQNFLDTYRYECTILKLDKTTLELQSNFKNYFNSPSAYIFSFRAQ